MHRWWAALGISTDENDGRHQTVIMKSGEFPPSGETPSSDLSELDVNPVQLKPNTHIGKYRIVKELGFGGQGRVLLAVDDNLKRQVALKTIAAVTVAGQERLDRFQNEARAVAQLRHPNIVQLYEAFHEEGVPFFSMEYVEGESLSTILRTKSLSRRQLVAVLATCCEAMGYAHQKGIVHRDLKPQNILLTPEGEPKVMDFGLAKCLLEDKKLSVATLEGQVLGSPAYMAPEQAEGTRELISARTDVYALGTILYECLTGRLPHLADSPMEIMLAIIDEEPEPPTSVDPTIGRDLNAICMKALEKDPRARYANAAELAADLKRYLNNEPVQARPATISDRFAKALRRNRDLAVVSGIALTFMAVALAVSITIFTRQSAENIKEGLRAEIMGVANTAAMMFPAEEIEQIRIQQDADSELFRSLVRRLNEIRRRNPRVRSAYVIRKTEKVSDLAYVADADAFLPSGTGEGTRRAGDKYVGDNVEALLRAFSGSKADFRRGGTTWGDKISGFSPIISEDGESVAVLGIEMGTELVKMQMRPALRTTAQVSALASFLFMGLTGVAGVRVMRRKKRRR